MVRNFSGMLAICAAVALGASAASPASAQLADIDRLQVAEMSDEAFGDLLIGSVDTALADVLSSVRRLHPETFAELAGRFRAGLESERTAQSLGVELNGFMFRFMQSRIVWAPYADLADIQAFFVHQRAILDFAEREFGVTACADVARYGGQALNSYALTRLGDPGLAERMAGALGPGSTLILEMAFVGERRGRRELIEPTPADFEKLYDEMRILGAGDAEIAAIRDGEIGARDPVQCASAQTFMSAMAQIEGPAAERLVPAVARNVTGG